MIRQMTGWEIAAQLRMERQVHKGALLLVEGPNDNKTLNKFIDSETCSVVIAFSKANALEALDLLEDEGFDGLLCIVDADFDHLEGRTYDLENLIITEEHDIDLMIFMSEALDVFLYERANQDKIRGQKEATQKDLRERLLEVATPLGYCRWVAERNNLALKFRDLEFDFVDEITLVSSDRLYQDIVLNSPSANCTVAELKQLVQQVSRPDIDLSHLCCGHDVTTILGIALRRVYGDLRDVHTWRSEIEAGLRLAFDMAAFVNSSVGRAIANWESSQIAFRVLKSS